MREWRADAVEGVQVAAWRAASWALRLLPLAISYRLASLAGTLTFAAWPRGREATMANFAVVLEGAPGNRVRRVARQSLENYCRYLVDFARVSGAQPKVPPVASGVEHFAELKRLMADGRGAVLVLTHSGNWDAGAAAAAEAGIALAVVSEPVGSPRFDRSVREARVRLGMRLLVMGRDTLAMARTLRNGGALAILVDRPDHEDGVPITFFGRETLVADGAARLAMRNGARIVAATCTRQPGTYDCTLHVDFGIQMPADADGADASRQLTQAIFASHERLIRAQPSQWYMFRRFWPPELR